jgi:hypothetical protein
VLNTSAKKPAPATADVYICPCDAGFILSVGPVSLWLERATAEDVLTTLHQALLAAPDGGDDSGSDPN